MKILNVAEKNDAAKNIASQLSNGAARMRDGISKFNKIYEFNLNIFGANCQMVMTSVSGHLLSLDFPATFQKWHACQPVELFDAPVEKSCPENFKDIEKTLRREIRTCAKLIIWTDCDREGENIGYEIIDVCRDAKPNIQVYRAIFSEITQSSMRRAIANLTQPNKLVSDAVDARMELDLRIGASFTRFQTLRLRKRFPQILPQNGDSGVISYGSCQFPTLGFVVERFKQREAFVSEPFWKIVVTRIHDTDNKSVEFAWDRVRLFDYQACLSLYEMCISEPSPVMAKVVEVKTKPKSKWRPTALDTVELEKSASRKLKINAKETMAIAEKLYTQGFISYPRTETNQFPKDFNLNELIERQTNDRQWGDFAGNLLQMGASPRNGTKSDQAHPPIHPTKYTNSLTGDQAKVYEFIVRHFLACCSRDAQGFETTATIEIRNEKFSATGLMITERNYLDVYPYDRWSDKEMPVFNQGDTFTPDSIELKEGRTEAPKLLTEADLIALMEKHGIGTDATHAEHIETIKTRQYATVNQQNFFLPLQLGLGLVEGYDSMGYEMSKPHLRRILEEDLKAICEGRKTKEEVLRAQISAYKNCFIDACENVAKLDAALSQYYGEASEIIADERDSWMGTPVLECGCKSQIVLKAKKDKTGFMMGCRAWPTCKSSIWFPCSIKNAIVTDEYCSKCHPRKIKKIRFKLERSAVLSSFPTDYTTCVLCDSEFKHHLEIDVSKILASFNNINTQNPTQTTSSSYNPNIVSRPTATTTTATTSNNNSSKTAPQKSKTTTNTNSSNIMNRSANTFLSPANNLFNTTTSRSQTTYNNNNNNDDDPSNPTVCNCGTPATLLVVRKEGVNQGREFYTCGNNKTCQFFLWKDGGGNSNYTSGSGGGGGPRPGGGGGFEGPSPSRATSNNYKKNNNQDDDIGGVGGANGEVMCNCNQPAQELTTTKEGVNKGRKFFRCGNNNQCQFFQWSDDDGKKKSFNKKKSPLKSKNNQSLNETAGQSDSGGVKLKKPRAAPKCGNCKEEGHTVKNCPN